MSRWPEEGGNGWRLILGDARDVVPSLDAVTCVATDPPYGFGHYLTDKDGGLVVEVLGACRWTRTMAVFGYPELLVGWCIALGRTPDEWVTWWPTNAGCKAGGRAKGLPRQTEHIALFGDAPGAALLRTERTGTGVKPMNTHLTHDARLGDVWRDPSPGIAFNARHRIHPNEKPVNLLLKLLTLASEAGDTVLDPFTGSGTTGVAALRLGRSFVGVELDPHHFQTASARLRAEESGSTFAASRAGQGALFSTTTRREP